MTLFSVSAAQTPARLPARQAKPWHVLQSGARSLLVRLQSISTTGPSEARQCQGELRTLIKHRSFMGTFH